MIDGFSPWPDATAAQYRERGYWRGVTLGSLLRSAAQAHGGRTALVDGGRRWTYRELDDWADRIASGLGAIGLRSGERVLVHLPNVAEFVALCFGMFRRGVIPVLALAAHRENEIGHLARLSGAAAYVIVDRHTGQDYRQTARAVRGQAPDLRHVLVIGDAAEFTPFARLDTADPAAAGGGHVEPAAGDVALMLLSGGSTGLPKLIPRTHDDYVYNATASGEVCGLGPDTRYLVTLPIGHNFPLACPGVIGTLAVGGTVVLCPSPSPDDAFAIIAAERITITAVVPAVAMLWLEAAQWLGTAGLGSLDLLQVGGSRLKPQAARQVRPVLGCRLQQVFGMAEGLLNFTRADDDDELVVGTQGRPLCPDDEVRVVDEDDREVEPGRIGELLTRGPYTVRGYYGIGSGGGSFTVDGFYRTGDLVRQLPSGHLVVEGRVKDVINRGGEKIPVEEVEEHILSHPGVRDVALVGVPDDMMGELSCAFVIANEAAPTRRELNAHLGGRGLAAFKLPDRLVVLDAFPRTAVGKADKRALAQLAEVGA